MTNGLWKGHLFVLIISLYWKNISRKQIKNPNANVQARQDVTFYALGYHPPTSIPAFHIYCVKYEDTIACKIISWNLGGTMF